MEASLAAVEQPRLLLEWQNQELWIAAGEQLVVGQESMHAWNFSSVFVSRAHITIEFVNSRFRLTDHSTNGTYVQMEDTIVHHVHRASMPLWGEGWLSLGEPIGKSSAIRFAYI